MAQSSGVSVLLFVGLLSLGFLLGLSTGQLWSLSVFPLLVAAFIVLTRPMHVLGNLPVLVIYGAAACGGAWSGFAMRRGVSRRSEPPRV